VDFAVESERDVFEDHGHDAHDCAESIIRGARSLYRRTQDELSGVGIR
jgi:hypothetical protein